MTDERKALTPWALRDRLERRIAAKKGVTLTWETTFVVLEAVRAYIANPKRDRVAAIICVRHNVRNTPCRPLCRRCSDLAWELKCLFRGVPNPFGEDDFYEGGGRKHTGRALEHGSEED
jgi:hypothetical protein